MQAKVDQNHTVSHQNEKNYDVWQVRMVSIILKHAKKCHVFLKFERY